MSLLPECSRCFGLLALTPSGYGLSSRCRCDDTPADTKAEAEYLAKLNAQTERDLSFTMQLQKDAADERRERRAA